MKRKHSIPFIVSFAVLIAALGFTSIQYVRAKAEATINAKAITRQDAIFAWKTQYQQALDKINVVNMETREATIIYWTENVTREGRITLHGSAVVNGVVYDSQQTNDVTDYLNK